MKKSVACGVLLLSTVLTRAGSITETVTIPAEDVGLAASGPSYQTPWLKHGFFSSDVAPGSPKLPCLTANLLLPQGAQATGVVVECEDVTLGTGVTLYPVQPVRTSSQMSTGAFVPPSPQIYAQTTPYPVERATLTGTHKMRGQSIAAVLLHPFQYNPARGEVFVARQIRLTVQYADTAPAVSSSSASSFMPTDHAFDDSVAALVLNPSALKSYSPSNDTPRVLGSSTCQYLIITKGANMIGAFWPLALYRSTNDGFTTQVRDVDGIDSMYSGRDKQERIRNCIKDYVTNRGTTYVVLGGDDTLVPDRDTWARVWMATSSGSVWCVDANIPTDAYYSNLDGDWDANANKVYGELADNVDFGVDVWVGRIPVRTAAEASNYVNKLMRYEKELTGYAGRLLVGGVAMFDTYTGTNRPSDALSDGQPGFQGHSPVSDIEMWGRRLYRDWIQNTGYTPSRLGLYFDTVTTRDTAWAGDYAVNGTSLTGLMNEGWFHMFYLGHGSPAGIAVETAPAFDVAALAACRNPPVGVFVSGTCLAGAFDDTTVDPCFSETLLRQREGGALSYVGSSRYGWFDPDGPPADNTSDGGDSFVFAQQFYKQVFTDKRSRLGSAFGNHKTALMGLATGDSGHRWLEYAINLQGDPALHLPDLTDTTPPTPDPPSFAKPPEALSSRSIRLTASTASDPSGVEYQFTETFGRGIPASEWQTNPVYVLTDLNPDTLFTFQVRTRDRSANHNVNDASAEISVKTPLTDGEVTAPTPNPMTWAAVPAAVSSTSVTMTATTATDEDGVEYKFEEQTGHAGGNSSAWQSSTVYTDTGLSPNTVYRYRVRARDTSINHNETTASIEASVTTPRVTLNDEWDPADDVGTDATALADPQVTLQTHGPHTLSATDTSDWFKVFLTVGSSNLFHTVGGTGDNYGELFSDAAGTSLVASDDDAGSNRQFSISYIAPVTTSYYLRVRAYASGTACAYTLKWSGVPTDPNPPIPNPMRFASLPAATSPSNVTMSALAAEDPSGVEYLFEETTGHAGGHSGTWQGSTEFANAGLEPDTTYGYRVRARDKSASQNMTDWSEVVAVHTPPVVLHDAWDPVDDTGYGATDLPAPDASEQTDGEHTLADTDGEDWFHFYLEVGTTNTFWSTGSMGDPVAYLSDLPDGNHLQAWDDDSAGELQFEITFTPAFSGDYYLKVIPRLGSGPCIYTLHYQRGRKESDLTLAEALDAEGEVWGTAGDINWVGTMAVSHDGQDAAVAGGLLDDQSASLLDTVNGPGTVGFWWRVSSELNYDFLSFAVDGVTNDAISGETDWTYITRTVGAGPHDLRWTYAKDFSNSNGSDAAWVDQFSFTPEGQPLPLFRSGDTAWFSQPYVTHDGMAAEQSGPLRSNQWTRLQTFVEGPGTLSYWCKVSSEANYDVLSMSVDGHTNLSLSGEQGWQCQTVTVWRPGPREISWVYQKDESVDAGLDAAWVDEIGWTPIPLDRDTDGDGQYDWQEGMAGVNPFDSNSLFRLEVPSGGFRSETGGFVLEWQSSTGVFYAVDHADSMTGGFLQIQNQIPGEASRTRYDCGITGADMDFYRVRVDE